jgi:hypothetical protein
LFLDDTAAFAGSSRTRAARQGEHVPGRSKPTRARRAEAVVGIQMNRF